MDDIVRAALKKWPSVPACHGWLGLDARGDWYMRDQSTQAQGPFPESKGSRIEHDKLRAFIERNYDCDAHGGWFFQNGPQRVYVELEAAPWVWRLTVGAGGRPEIQSHTGRRPSAGEVTAWTDEFQRLFLATPLGLGLVHTLDMEIAADALENGDWLPPQSSSVTALADRFGHCLSPQTKTRADAPERATDHST